MTTRNLLPDFTTGSIPKHLLEFAAPLFFSNLLQIVYNMVDMVSVGQKIGQSGLSAVSIGGDVSHFLTFFAMGFSSAGQVIISQYVGSKQTEKIGRFIAAMVSALAVSAVLISGVCLYFRKSILNLMNTPPEAYSGALAYSTVCMMGLLFIYGYNAMSAILRGLGDAKHPFIFISIAAVLNVLLDLAFVHMLDMGCEGAAVATVISQSVSFLLSAVFFIRKRKTFCIQISLASFREIEKSMLASLFKLGLPMAIKSAAVQLSKLSVNSWINTYGVSISAVSGIGGKINSLSSLVANAANAAGSTIVAQNIGAKKFDRVPKIMGSIAAATLGTAVIMSSVLLFFPKAVFGIFTNEPEVLRYAMEYLPVAVMIFYGTALRSPMNALIDGSGNYKVNFMTALLDGIVMRIGLAVLLGYVLDYGYMGFWMGDVLAGFTPVLIGTVYAVSGKWKKGIVEG